MTDIALASNVHQRNPLIYIAWDIQNVKLKPNKLPEFASNLLDFGSARGRLDCKRVYYNSQHTEQASAKNNLDYLGFDWRNVPSPLKNSADDRLIADCIHRVAIKPSPEVIILVLGDKDFAGLICVLRSLGKKVIIFAQRGSESKKLIKIADEFHFVDELPSLIVGKNQLQAACLQSQITYKDATEYLLETIRTALSQGKRTSFSLIDSLMRQRFSNYHGASSICKPDGKKFSRFSKFVDAVVAEGKVRMQNQELFLIEKHTLAT
ncbi:MAG: NYN domain-containing protein [Cyanobacteriota bacterium]